MKTITDLTPKLHPHHWEIINQTPFVQFFLMRNILKLERNLLNLLVGLYDKQRQAFVVVGKLLKLNEVEFSLVLGLPIKGKFVFVNGPMKSKTYDSYFRMCEFMRPGILKQVLYASLKHKIMRGL